MMSFLEMDIRRLRPVDDGAHMMPGVRSVVHRIDRRDGTRGNRVDPIGAGHWRRRSIVSIDCVDPVGARIYMQATAVAMMH